MKIIKNIKRTYNIKYVDCSFLIDELNKCQLNGISSTAQTIRNLPFLNFNRIGFEWSPRINLETGKVLCWPKGLKAIINFKLNFCVCTYLTDEYTTAFDDTNIPNYLQLDLIDNGEHLSFTINGDGFIENWPKLEEIIRQVSLLDNF